MKRLIILCLIFILFTSCGGDDNVDYNLEILPIESVDIPKTLKLGETYPITVSYYRPSTCYEFKEFYYSKNNNEHTLAVINYEYINDNCTSLNHELVESSFNFKPTQKGKYIFKFWQGKDDGINDNDANDYTDNGNNSNGNNGNENNSNENNSNGNNGNGNNGNGNNGNGNNGNGNNGNGNNSNGNNGNGNNDEANDNDTNVNIDDEYLTIEVLVIN